jgi:RNA polymerase sigma-70 factor (ECF subfamily)
MLSPPKADTAERQAHFEAVYAANHAPILGYALRRTASPDDAADILAETFLTAWRRLDELPAETMPGCGCTAWPGGCSPTTTAANAAGPRWPAGSVAN